MRAHRDTIVRVQETSWANQLRPSVHWSSSSHASRRSSPGSPTTRMRPRGAFAPCPGHRRPAVALILKLHFRADVVPDYLHRHAGNYFNRGGFCFAFGRSRSRAFATCRRTFRTSTTSHVSAESRYARGCGFLRRAKIETVIFAVDCEPAAFGFVRIAVPLMKEVQGSVSYSRWACPSQTPAAGGRGFGFGTASAGCELRVRGTHSPRPSPLTVALSGTIVLTKTATATIDLPLGVAENVPGGSEPEKETLWRLGDPPLDHAG